MRSELLAIVIAATPAIACAARAPKQAELLVYHQPAPHVLDAAQTKAFEAFADALWGDKSLLTEVCVSHQKAGYVARAAGVLSAKTAAVGEVKDGKVVLYQNSPSEKGAAK